MLSITDCSLSLCSYYSSTLFNCDHDTSTSKTRRNLFFLVILIKTKIIIPQASMPMYSNGLLMYAYIYVLELNQTVLELDVRAVKYMV